MTHSPSTPTPAAPEQPAAPHAKGWTCFEHGKAAALPPVIGERFEVGELLGVGGASCVYACRDRALRSMAALKVLRSASDDARRRFVEEGRILACLRDPHLVQVLAVGELDDGTPYTALEMLPGRSLEERLQAGPLPWREVVELAAQAAGALAALHRFGVIHRDVKPSNLVQLNSATGRLLVKLIDLGTAKVHDWQRVQAGSFTPPPRHQTDAGLVVGTPGFYPPEASLVAPDPRFDTFGLGVTIYLLCTGTMPNLADLRPMAEVNPTSKIPPELDALVTSALAVLREDRLASAGEFQRRLETIRAAHAEDAEPFLFDGCYELLQVLGAGAKAEVYRAYHRDAARYVALKLLSAESCTKPEERLRFAREARVLGAVKHPGLPELIECRTSPRRKQPYIAMSLVKGRCASDFCIATHRLPPADVLAVGKSLAGALAALHERGILHRDVHTSNVLIDLGRETTATLLDVGMADLTDMFYATVEQRYPTPPEARVNLGTGGLEQFEWTAPEARSGKGWTAKSDVYSLALLLYKVLTGKRPVPDERVSPREHVPGCPLALASALLGGLDADPDRRIDLATFIARLDAATDELAENEEVEAVEEPAASTPRADATASPRPRSKLRAAMFAALGAAALLLAWFGGRASVPRAEVDRPVVAVEQPPPRPHPVAADAAIPMPSLPAIRDALAAAESDLRRCSALAGGLLFVQFVTAEDADRFSEVNVRGSSDEAVSRCVRDATAALRFQPTTAQSFAEEYTP